MSWLGGTLVINNKNQKTMKKAMEDISSAVRHESDLEEFPNMGLHIMNIREIQPGKVFADFDAAERYCMNEFTSWMRNYNVMVAFSDTSCVKTTKHLSSLKERMDRETDKMNTYAKEHSVSEFKASYVSCPKCGSKINKDYIGYDRCPLCKTDLRSETTKKTIARYKNNIIQLKKQIKDEEQKQKDKLPVRYLVAYCEYTG